MAGLMIALSLICLSATGVRAQYAVGTADVTYYDPARNDRPVPCDLYYPALADGPGQPVAEPPAVGFAAVAFGHGFQMSADLYGWVAENLARMGCVVALPRTAGELFPDHGEFGLDLAFVCRELRDAGDDPGSPFHGRMGPRTAVMGHSMGGGSSFLAAAGDPSITAVANFAAAETNPSAIAACGQLERQVLVFAGTNDCVAPPGQHQLPMYEALGGGSRTYVNIEGASHCQFNDYTLLCTLGEFCSADISRLEQQNLTWQLLELWTQAVLFLDANAASSFQALLATGDGWTWDQAGQTTAVGDDARALRPRLSSHPNPSNPRTTLTFVLPTASHVRLSIHDMSGRRLASLIDDHREAGTHTLIWEGRDSDGNSLPSGVYFCEIETGEYRAMRKMTLLK